jgi:hypothetical protein
MKRTKQHMEREIYIKALRLAQYCYQVHGQRELNLCGIGESTMHPEFDEFVRLAREMMPDVRLVIASNGVKVTEEHIKTCARYGLDYYVSLHRPEVAGPVIEMAKKHGVLRGVSADPSIAAMNWAGQVDWHVSAQQDTPCPWLKDQMVMVTAEGDLVSCCLDGDGLSKLGTVDSDINQLNVKPYSLCKHCTHSVPVSTLEQLKEFCDA